MPRIMTIWLPRWPVQRRLLERPELRKVPVFVCRRQPRGVLTIVSWAWSSQPRSCHSSAGSVPDVTPILDGMSVAEGMAVLTMRHGSRACHIVQIESDDPLEDRQSLEQLARWCRRFAPVVAIEDAPQALARNHLGQANGQRPECLHLDVTGTAHFFGGEGPLVRTVVWTLAARGIHARAAIADTPGAAWAAAHHTDHLWNVGASAPLRVQVPLRASSIPRHRRWAVVPPETQTIALAMLPAAAIRLDAAVLSQLRELGIDTIGGVLRLPRKSLASRFAPLLAQRIAHFTGALAEPFAIPLGDELPHTSQNFDFPVAMRDVTEASVCTILEKMIGECVAPLAAQGKGLTSLQVRLERSRAIDPQAACVPTVIDVGLYRPSISVKHIVELTRLRLSRMRLPAEIEGIAVEVVAVGPTVCRQRSLFGEATVAAASQVGLLLDRLSGRLGRQAVFEPRLVADAQPEHAWMAVPPQDHSRQLEDRRISASRGLDAVSQTNVSRGQCASHLRFTTPERRPTVLLPRPLRVETVSVVPNGPPLRFRCGAQIHQVVQAYGPERIETAWWRGPIVRRDAYVVETHTGARYWLFRRLRDGAWFLHGFFA